MPLIKSVPWVQLYGNGDGALKGTRVVGLHSKFKENLSFDIQNLGTVDDHLAIIHKPVFPFKVRLEMNILLHVNHKN